MSLLLQPVPRPRRRTAADHPEQRTSPAVFLHPLWHSLARRVAARRIGAGAAAAFFAQVVAVGGLLLAYHFARALADGKTSVAFSHSTEVWRLERALRLPSELPLQQWFLHHPTLAQLADAYYAGVHFPFTGVVLVYLYLRRRNVYRVTRDTIGLLTAASLVLAFAFPLAPPRMRSDLGFTDIAATFGQSVYGPPGTGTANQFAAMPSLHVGWALLVGASLIAAGHSRWRWLWLAHPVVTIAVVVGTANHYWSDGIVGAGLLLVAATAAWGLARRRQRRLLEAIPGPRQESDEGAGQGAAPDRNHPFDVQQSPVSTARASCP